MKLMPSPTARWMSFAASSSDLPALSPSRLNPPPPSPATLTLRPVLPSVVYSMMSQFPLPRGHSRPGGVPACPIGHFRPADTPPALDQSAPSSHLVRVKTAGECCQP